MQPLVDKLPALLLSAKPSTRAKRREAAVSDRSSARPGSAASTESHRTHSRRTERPDRQVESGSGSGKSSAKATKPSSNQETHDTAVAGGDRPPLAPRAKPPRRKAKKASAAPLTALEQVQKRKRMFATWIKHASSNSDGSNNTTPDSSAREEESAPDSRPADDNAEHGVDNAEHGVQLPPLSPSQPPSDALRPLQTSRGSAPGRTSQTRLPPITHASRTTPSAGWDLVYESIVAGGTSSTAASSSDPSSSPHTAAGTETAACDLDDSLDEDEVNSFLNWTDTLACPNDLELDDSSLLDE
jgi:hypothetical protein